MRDIERKTQDMKQRIRNSSHLHEVHELQMLVKQMQVVAQLMDVVQSHSMDSDKFRRVYDLQQCSLKLPPVCTVEMPKHLRWSRNCMDIQSTEQTSRWLSRTSSSALRANGVSDIESEQMRHWAERLANILRVSDAKSKQSHMHELFSLDCDYDLEARLNMLLFFLSDLVCGILSGAGAGFRHSCGFRAVLR